ncbi:MAG TPA: iron ABC transporter permease [Gammaproteobacteria bacterium]|nr:iron ABC transporter permease [Gammaproteobacteria bacterium]
MRAPSPSILFATLFLAALASAWFSLESGSAPIGLWTALQAPDSTAARILWELRLPRAATAFVTGALLGIAGTLMQVLLRNPLADPYVLGISGGASVAALLALLAGAGSLLLQSSAFAGALFSTLLVFSLAHGRGNWDTTRLLLTGVVLAAGWSALISLLLALTPGARLQGMLFWLMGDLGGAGAPLAGTLVLLLVLPLCLLLAPSLNLLARGELQAAALGVATRQVRIGIYLLASLATAMAVSQAGNIGFVGLIAPHMLRLAGARDHRLLLPAVVLLGGTLLLLADALSRTLLAPRQLPVGVLTALIGVPLFLYLLYRAHNRGNA